MYKFTYKYGTDNILISKKCLLLSWRAGLTGVKETVCSRCNIHFHTDEKWVKNSIPQPVVSPWFNQGILFFSCCSCCCFSYIFIHFYEEKGPGKFQESLGKFFYQQVQSPTHTSVQGNIVIYKHLELRYP